MSAPAPLITSPAFRLILDALARHGVDPTEIAARHGLEGTSLPLLSLSAFAEDCCAAVPERLFAVQAGLSLPRGSYGAPEFLWRTAPTLREAWHAVDRNQRLVSELFRPGLRVLADGAAQLFYPSLGPSRRLIHEFTVGVGVMMLRELTGGAAAIRRIGFAHPSPAERPELERLLGAPLAAEQADNYIELAPGELDRPVVSSDPPLFAVLSQLVDQVRASVERPSDLLGQVEQAVAQQLSRGEVRMEAVARTLRLSERTLQRRLKEENTSLRERVEAVRLRRARELVLEGALPLSEVAWRLGFSQFTAFARAYKRWTGESPGAARERLAGASLSPRGG